mmetsp:Transcript_18970/g.16358  ORF Transcript_18970/g.16358 Transcript_18970/m.16358 type:complete len:82 (-) Transcript_18970:480-725(-)
MERTSNLRNISELQEERIIRNLKTSNKAAGDVIYNKGEKYSSKLVILIEGKLRQGAEIIANTRDIFGDKYLKEGKRDEEVD